MFILIALSLIEYKSTNFNVIIRQQCHLVTFPVSRRPRLARQSVSSTFRAGDAPYYAPLVNFYQESVRCMKLTLVTYASPISISWKAFHAVINRKKKIQWMGVHFMGGQMFYLPETHLRFPVDPSIDCLLRWGGGTRSRCVPRVSPMHFPGRAFMTAMYNTALYQHRCMASDCCFPLQLSFEIVSGAWQRSGGCRGCAGDAQGG